ncbi:hypothetical protein EV356DRAFT_504903 [Viridothelium virens]|uniref:Uncharacterized protein n=1 Tax=Viridothelium virens TaxID=1048519 RepID=A0A6A6H3I3_VIRVR|nr:hypothetical protein EV356DRAFT_504903 [Viridothelium virens]
MLAPTLPLSVAVMLAVLGPDSQRSQSQRCKLRGHRRWKHQHLPPRPLRRDPSGIHWLEQDDQLLSRALTTRREDCRQGAYPFRGLGDFWGILTEEMKGVQRQNTRAMLFFFYI